jgi:hypothetical protein
LVPDSHPPPLETARLSWLPSLGYGCGAGLGRVWAGPQTIVRRSATSVRDFAIPWLGVSVPDPPRRMAVGCELARQLCDLVKLRNDSTGTAVRVHLTSP